MVLDQRLDDRLRVLLAILDIRPLRICLLAVLAAPPGLCTATTAAPPPPPPPPPPRDDAAPLACRDDAEPPPRCTFLAWPSPPSGAGRFCPACVSPDCCPADRVRRRAPAAVLDIRSRCATVPALGSVLRKRKCFLVLFTVRCSPRAVPCVCAWAWTWACAWA